MGLVERNRFNMQKKNLIRFVESFILFPILSISSLPAGVISQAAMGIVGAPSAVFLQELNMGGTSGALAVSDAVNEAMYRRFENRMARAEAIDRYFEAREMPLSGMGMKMVEEAERNDIDWRLLPAIAIRESTGGKNACKGAEFNSFGWGSCKINFDSDEHAIEIVAMNLGGNNPNTAKHYDNKSVLQILRT